MGELILFKLDTDEAVLYQRVERALGVGLRAEWLDQIAHLGRSLVVGGFS